MVELVSLHVLDHGVGFDQAAAGETGQPPGRAEDRAAEVDDHALDLDGICAAIEAGAELGARDRHVVAVKLGKRDRTRPGRRLDARGEHTAFAIEGREDRAVDGEFEAPEVGEATRQGGRFELVELELGFDRACGREVAAGAVDPGLVAADVGIALDAEPEPVRAALEAEVDAGRAPEDTLCQVADREVGAGDDDAVEETGRAAAGLLGA